MTAQGTMGVVPFKSVGAYRLGKTREECRAACGPAESEKNNPGMQTIEEMRGGVRASFAKNKLIEVWLPRGDADVIVKGQRVFTADGLAALRGIDSAFREQGSFMHFPTLGVIVGGMGKRRLAEGPLAIVYAKSRQKYLDFLGAV
jgi:hypothetical protein